MSEKIGFIGGGNMARSLIGGLTAKGHAGGDIYVAEPQAGLLQSLRGDYKINAAGSNADVAMAADVLILAVKPQVVREACAEIRAVAVARRPLLISIAAGIQIRQLEAWLGGSTPIVRAMPNTPALIGAGISGLCANCHVDEARKKAAERMLQAVGEIIWVDDEAQMDLVTAVSGSGPAYFFLLIEAMEAAATAQGMAVGVARQLVLKTALGAARMAAEGTEAASELRKRVTSPGGTTQAAIEAFQAHGFERIVAEAIAKADARGRELSKQFGSAT